MRAKLARLGNSRGVRIPQLFINEIGLSEEVEITMEGGDIVIRAPWRHPRDGWAEAFLAAEQDSDEEIGGFGAWPLDESASQECEWPLDVSKSIS